MALNAKVLTIVATCIMLLTWIFYVAANAFPGWSKYSVSTYDYTLGLWQSCVSGSGTRVCTTYTCSSSSGSSSSTCGKISAAKAFVTIACLFSAVSAICLLVSLALRDKQRSILLTAGRVLAFTCFIAGIIGVAVGINVMTSSMSGMNLSWGGASIIGIIAIIINLVGAITSVFIQ